MMTESEATARWNVLKLWQNIRVAVGLTIVLLISVGLWWLALAAINAWIQPWGRVF